MHYYGKVKKYGDNVDVSYYGEYGHNWNYERLAGRKLKRNIQEMNFEDLYKKAVLLKRSFPKKIKTFEETISCNEFQYPDYGKIQIGELHKKCLTKMLTVTFKEDIQTKGEAYKQFDRVLKSVEKRISKYFNIEKYKVVGIGVYERHKKNRTGYHVHMICFNIPWMKKEWGIYQELKEYVQSKLKATIRIDVPKQSITYDENNNVKIRSVDSMKTYLKKTFNYVRKQFSIDLGLTNGTGQYIKQDDPVELNEDFQERMIIFDKLRKILPDLIDGKTFIKRGKLKKPVIDMFKSLEEFELVRNRLLEGGKHKVKDVLVTSNFIPVTFLFLEVLDIKIKSTLNKILLEFICREYKGFREKWYCWETKKTYTSCVGYILKEE